MKETDKFKCIQNLRNSNCWGDLKSRAKLLADVLESGKLDNHIGNYVLVTDDKVSYGFNSPQEATDVAIIHKVNGASIFYLGDDTKEYMRF